MIRAVLFDWGDTVMRNLPYPGAMADWPRVEAVPGAGEALEVLSERYRLALATNAEDSGPAQIKAALQRVGLGEAFSAILTARRLGARKPERGFFVAALAEMAFAPGEVAMVGDDYHADISGAKEAGLRAVWYNPRQSCCPVPHPLHDAEIASMNELPGALAGLHLPDVAECRAMLLRQDAPPPVLRHVEAVAALTYRLAVGLRRAGVAINPLVAHRGALLHDLDKITSLQQGRIHGELGAEILRGVGQPVLADIVERHLMSAILDPERGPRTWEQKLVYYCDKVVEGDRVVTFAERLEALCGRYPQYAEEMRACESAVLALEEEIRRMLGASPSQPTDDA